MATRKTLAKSVNCTATGVQSGQQLTLALHPASAGSGLQLVRTDIGQQWPVSPQTAFAAAPGTAIGNSQYHVLFVEHLLAALAAAEITDLTIEISGPEIPLFEGGLSPMTPLRTTICTAVSIPSSGSNGPASCPPPTTLPGT